jgi:Cytochrome P460
MSVVPSGWRVKVYVWPDAPPHRLEPVVVRTTGRATTVQIMIKDSMKYASTGGWGFGRFIDGKAVGRAQHETCFGCHQAHVKDHDFVFTRLAP